MEQDRNGKRQAQMIRIQKEIDGRRYDMHSMGTRNMEVLTSTVPGEIIS